VSAKEQKTDVAAEGPTQEPGGTPPEAAPKASDAARSAEEIRADIDATREDMGDTVEALAAKTDVKGQAKARVQEAKKTVAAKREAYAGKARSATPDDAQQAGRQALATVKANPAPVAIGGAVLIGFLLGKATSR
jgi:hypothetical protein